MPHMSYAIKTRGRIGQDIQALAQKELTRTIEAFQALDATTVASLAHDIRKRLKKLRALISLLRQPLGKKAYRLDDTALREAGRGLAAVRDAQILIKTLQQLQRRFFSGKTPVALRPLREALLRHEQECTAALLDSVTLQKSIVALEASQVRAADWPIKDYGWKELRQALKRSYRRSRESYLQAREVPSAAHLHRWRKRVKDLWAHVRLIQRICPALMEELAQDFKVLGEFLGNDHDLVVLRADLEKRFETRDHAPAVTTFLDLLDLRRDELLDAAFDLGERLHTDAPAEFARELDALRAASRERKRKAKKLTTHLSSAA